MGVTRFVPFKSLSKNKRNIVRSLMEDIVKRGELGSGFSTEDVARMFKLDARSLWALKGNIRRQNRG